MARKTKTVTVEAEGRDQGKAFVLTEMPAEQVEKWAGRVLLAMGQSGVTIPDGIERAGFAGVASLGLRAFFGLHWFLAEPLLDEMFECVAFLPDPAKPMVLIKAPLASSQIEEVATRLQLREEVISLHMGFSVRERLSDFLKQARAAKEAAEKAPPS